MITYELGNKKISLFGIVQMAHELWRKLIPEKISMSEWEKGHQDLKSNLLFL